MEQILVGELKNPNAIETDSETVPVKAWHGRAVWSYLRLHYGKRIDDKIKGLLDGRRMSSYVAMEEVLKELYPEDQRRIQFILSPTHTVLAVATTRHLIIPPATVYKTTEEILGKKLTMSERLDGGSVYVSKIAGLHYGIQIHGGTITTRFAVRIGALIRVELCFNPLSWLGADNFNRFGITGAYERVLRIQRITELRPRLEQAINTGKHGLGQLRKTIQHTRKVTMSEAQAKTLTYAMSKSYGLGNKTIDTVLERFEAEDQTQYGLAMALSYIAEHGELRKTPEGQRSHASQKLSTIGAGVLLVDDIPKTTEKSLAWLKKRCPELKI